MARHAERSTKRPTMRHTPGKRRIRRRTLNGVIALHVPATVVKAKSAPYLSRGKPECRNPLIKESDHTIVNRFGTGYRGIVQYYLLAHDVHRLHRLRWVMETSMLKTLACKPRSSVTRMADRFKAKSHVHRKVPAWFGPGAVGKGPAHSRHLANGLPVFAITGARWSLPGAEAVLLSAPSS